MQSNDEPFVPDSLDEQLAILSRHRSDQRPVIVDAELVHDLQALYASEKAEQEMLNAVWVRLLDYLENKEDVPQAQEEQRAPVRPLSLDKKRSRRQEGFSRQRPLVRLSTLVAAVLVIALLAGSFALTLTLAHHGGGNTATEPGSASSGVYVGTDGGIYHTDEQTGKLLWAYSLPGDSEHGGYLPVSVLKLAVSNGTVYASASGGAPPTQAFILALDAATGHLRWKHAFANGSNLSDMAVTTGVLYASVIPPDKHVADGFTYALNLTDGGISATYPVAGDITVVNQVLYTTGAGISAVNLTTGRLLWHTPVNGVTLNAPHVVNGVLYTSAWFSYQKNYLTHDDGYVYAFDARSGTKLWQSSRLVGGNLDNPTPITDVIVANTALYVGLQNRVSALDTRTGDLLWSQGIDGSIDQPLLIGEGTVYAAVSAYGQDSESCAVVALQAQNGHEIWASLPGGGNVLIGPAMAHGMIYVANVTTYALNPSDGIKLWQASIPNPYMSDPIVIVAVE